MPARFSLLRSLRAICLFFAAVATLHAHRPFEITSIARLQHGRLEVTVTLSLALANLLVGASAEPEAPALDAAGFDHYRERLLTIAAGFYEVREGNTLLKPEKILASLNKSQEPEFSLVYPAPAAGPLRMRATGLVPRGPDGSHLLVVYNDDEEIIAHQRLGRDGPEAELSLPPSPSDTP